MVTANALTSTVLRVDTEPHIAELVLATPQVDWLSWQDVYISPLHQGTSSPLLPAANPSLVQPSILENPHSSTATALNIPIPPALSKLLKPQGGVKRTRSARILGPQALDLGLGLETQGLGRIVGAAHVGELVADAVGDDVGVEGVLLALGDERVRGQEGALGGLAPGAAELEVDGRLAGAEVGAAILAGVDGGRRGGGGREEGEEEDFGVHFGCGWRVVKTGL